MIVLSLLTVVSFLAVGGLAKVYNRQQQFLGDRWFNRGVADLQAGRSEQAVNALRSALLYSRDNYQYQLKLAQALAALHRTDEAYAYLQNLWEREPDNGTTNLELGRIEAGKGQMDQALRYYHNAIYAAWPDNPDQHRRSARLELIQFLLRQNALTQAQSELIALAANLTSDSALHLQVGDLFMQVQDYEHALAQYRETVRADRRNSAALAGAGRAAFELTRYEQARRYLEAAVAADAQDTQSAELLHTATLVMQMDPYRRPISVSKRNRLVINAFKSAGQRIKACAPPLKPGAPAQPASSSAAGSNGNDEKSLASTWNNLKPKITERGLRRDPDLVDTAMDLVFAIERQTSTGCGTLADTDTALLLISKLHGGS